uniref:Capsid protein n=1 Tax=Genomoviridae sp. TaxID=2202565 RepID=A0A8F5MJK6_9VIRU|nr:MAG: capsid protein [Genomoviridae sp.]QXN75482.1 MAG: capsid protein [Genomoviridae sp.]QXN75484.1 MAG: capsid protein [Genomoviridae sp.]QXN75486.1 MAG: capsid protein [Genomoviridae sp.]
MPYRRRYATRRRPVRRYNRRSTTAFKPKRYGRRTTTRYRRKTSTRMSKRRILDLTTTKKKDNKRMYDPANVTNNFFSMPRGGTSYLYCPTAMGRENNNVASVRNNSTVYMKGLSEKMELSPTNGKTWKWRRIVFSTKGFRPASSYIATTDGYLRLWRAMAPADEFVLADRVFQGLATTDFGTYFTGKVDTNRVKLHMDKTTVLGSGNQNAYLRSYNHWIPMEKNFRYDEDENGDEYSSSPWSAEGNYNLGDVFIWDIFTDVGADTADTLTVRSGTTLYWHEK